jgi:polysaccharide deacetylase 2 family uncharacterized protein YibQ
VTFYIKQYTSMFISKAGCKKTLISCVFLFMTAVSLASDLDDDILPATDGLDDTNTTETFFSLPESLGPVVTEESETTIEFFGQPIINAAEPWSPALVPFLEEHLESEKLKTRLSDDTLSDNKKSEEDSQLEPESKSDRHKKDSQFSPIQAVDIHPKQAVIAILIDDLGYNRHGMESSLALPKEVALAILPETPFARKTALASQKQKRITLLHAPMENQRELALGPGGLYAKMTEDELKATLNKDLDGLPGIQGVNNHMGSLLTTKADSMTWVMEILKGRSLFFIDSLTSPKSVAEKIAQEHGLKTVSRDVFLDNIRTENAIDRQFSRLIKQARLHGKALAIGHPYPETTAYLKKRLSLLEEDGVRLIPLTEVLQPSDK